MKNIYNYLSNRIYCGFAIILSLCFLIACDSDDAPSQESLLPPITMTGENTFGCLIDGKFFKPRDGDNIISSGNRGLRVIGGGNNSTEFEANDFKSDNGSYIIIHAENLIMNGVGIYQIDESNGLRGLDGNSNSYITCLKWNKRLNQYDQYRSYHNSGSLKISKLDIIQNVRTIWSGEFNSKLVNSQNDTIQISLGRFDIETPKISTVSFP